MIIRSCTLIILSGLLIYKALCLDEFWHAITGVVSSTLGLTQCHRCLLYILICFFSFFLEINLFMYSIYKVYS